MFEKILVANRGEVACRVIRTARRMGVRTVAVYSEADRDAPHVAQADEAFLLGPAPASQSYLAIDRLLDACKATGAEAVHPGYGFLSENPEFPRRLEAEGVVFIGPRAEAVAAMGDKIASKRIARAAGVSTVPGSDGPVGSAAQAVEAARAVGYPVMVKASAGGGGKGLRVARDDAQTAEAFEACRAEARNAFGDDRVFVEAYIRKPRHVEIQVVGDAHGSVVHLGERECSLQRRHQKVIEEAPSPLLDAETRRAMGAQAVALARAVGYNSAGTVEFVVGGEDRRFYFLEMNTRLQVEHPVTEMVTGLDLVELMIRVAAGERLPFGQDHVRFDGWAVECRVNAEDPSRGFLPATGRLVRYAPPPEVPGAVRVETGVAEGGEVSVFYDPMIAKVITHGPDRSAAIARMADALDAFVLRGVASNLAFQAALVRHPRFLAGDLDTNLIADEFPGGFRPDDCPPEDPALLAAAAAYARRRYAERAMRTTGQMPGMGRAVGAEWAVLARGRRQDLSLTLTGGGCDVVVSEGRSHALRTNWSPGQVLLRGTWDGAPVCLQVERRGLRFRVSHRGARFDALVMTPRAAELLALMPEKPPPDLSRFLIAPMPGLLTEVAVGAGQDVRAGERLAVIEAMKMQNVLKAEADGVVDEVLASPGETLAVDQPILRFR